MRLACFLIAFCFANAAAAGLPYVECRLPAANLPEVEQAYADCPACVAGYDPAPRWIIRCAHDAFKERNYCLMQQSGADHRAAGLSFYRDAAAESFFVVGSSLLIGRGQVTVQIDSQTPATAPSGQGFGLGANSEGDAGGTISGGPENGADLLAQLRQGVRLHASVDLAPQLPPETTTLSIAGFSAAYDKMTEVAGKDHAVWTEPCADQPAPGACCRLPD